MTYRRFWVYFLLFLLNTISYTDRVNMSLAGHLTRHTLGEKVSLAAALAPSAG
jgi:hypothetical protein